MNIWEFINSVIRGFVDGASLGFLPSNLPQGRQQITEGYSFGFLAGVTISVILVIILWRNLA